MRPEAITASRSLSGYEAQFVLSGMGVIPAINGWTPDIAILDINMPGMDGFAVARQLRQHERSQHIVIVAFTAQYESAIQADGIAAGFDGVVPERRGAGFVAVFAQTNRRLIRKHTLFVADGTAFFSDATARALLRTARAIAQSGRKRDG
jgi:CheY-like chemotaxis protein